MNDYEKSKYIRKILYFNHSNEKKRATMKNGTRKKQE